MSDISVVIPFADPHEERTRVLDWMKPYWEHHLEAEFIVQRGPEQNFSKTTILNEAISKASGEIIVALDADVIFAPEQMREAIAVCESERSWAMPYGQMFRLNMSDTEAVLAYDPQEFVVSSQVASQRVREQVRAVHFGAAAMVYPKQAWEEIGGFDQRCVGWGSEDEIMKITLDTMWYPSHILAGPLFHLEHVRIGMNMSGVGNGLNRKWAGQESQLPNLDLRNEYAHAAGDKTRLQKILDQR
jgi:glycosyltransferase involved in cell wall biosynthesis